MIKLLQTEKNNLLLEWIMHAENCMGFKDEWSRKGKLSLKDLKL